MNILNFINNLANKNMARSFKIIILWWHKKLFLSL